jgi:hypothetical protein
MRAIPDFVSIYIYAATLISFVTVYCIQRVPLCEVASVSQRDGACDMTRWIQMLAICQGQGKLCVRSIKGAVGCT